MKILVTGGAGFIGSNFILYMLDKYKDYEIVNLDKLTYASGNKHLESLADNPRYQLIRGDIRNRRVVREVMAGCDTVVHFAAESHVDRSITEPAIFIETNVLGTQALLETALDLNVKRFHHISTDEVFGTLPLDKPEIRFTEESPYAPRSPYSASKAASDHLVRAYSETYGLPITISNSSNNYGPNQFPEKIIPLFIKNALSDRPIPIYGEGKAVRDYIFVEDHCRAIDLILHQGIIGETYCIGGDAGKTGLEIADTILAELKKPQYLKEFVADRKGHDMRYAIDHSKITRELGWTPTTSFEEGIKRTIAWYNK